MSDYIDRQQLLSEFEETCITSFYELNEHSKETFHELKRLVETAPSINIREDVEGVWIQQFDETDGTYYTCSICGEKADINYWEYFTRDKLRMHTSDYCPNCGVYMKGNIYE